MKSSPSSAAAYIPPPGVIEVVSTNWKDDYLTKLAEYEDLGVLEYIIVDYAAFGGMPLLIPSNARQTNRLIARFTVSQKDLNSP